MKHLVKLLFLFTLIAFIYPTAIHAAEPVEIGLHYGDNAPQTIQLSGGQLSFGHSNIPAFTDITLSVGDVATVFVSSIPTDSVSSGPFFVNDEGVYLLHLDVPPEGADVKTISNRPIYIHQGGQLVAITDQHNGIYFFDIARGAISVNGQAYAGDILIKPSGNKLTVINRIDAERYLCGVLPYEMSTGWPKEALKAQAVAARNYLLNNGKKHNNDGFDLCNTTHCQVYRGISGEADDCTQAVLETSGVCLYYKDKPAQTFYFSSSGGRTENVKDVWGSSFPYLVSVEDPYEKTDQISSANWTYTISKTDLEKQLSSYNLGSITDVAIISFTDGGRAKQLRITGELNSVEMNATTFRSAIGNTKVKGTYFSISKLGQESVFALSANETNECQGPIYTMSAEQKSKATSVTAILGANGVHKPSFDFDKVTFSGRGNGHGVGMSQWGARGMAEAGFTYDQILTHYFTGTELKKEG